MTELRRVDIFTDGSCKPNPGRGGYGVVLCFDGSYKEISCGYRKTTNNRMEMMAAIEGLETLKQRCNVTLHSDSKYLVDAIRERWVYKWQSRGWMRNNIERAENSDLWERLINVCARHDVDFQWVKGHAGDPLNERCDQLAGEAANGSYLETDQWYEDQSV
ncbi:MAG: ribonuclease HI [SAR202 cluster bacterium]|nr:ribonuclease HI [Dehalococcoidia bacterium]MDP7578565.1 ribonuclease HI [SAR202 cluster bacterium]